MVINKLNDKLESQLGDLMLPQLSGKADGQLWLQIGWELGWRLHGNLARELEFELKKDEIFHEQTDSY